ncbi:glutathione S-transferase family protein [Acuticoccus sp. MNP-M23]|uniref:glutathione S-transferase family protein n=1 Tax=Acuticoccus sp. MNP-M23 TaxID=3072793 RepID=UPI002814E6AD|nr:glutathione S-transferase family protein [Acuticoccus sp. MNP-M23]WMS41578.1 glutathione S-transferase family protein [Acuticoccus sp. MNP-M23]
MIKLHCLAYSRALRVVWLLEALDAPYELVKYDRTSEFQAPEALKAVHPLGKSPTIEDGDLILAESATILRYVQEKHGKGRFVPAPGTTDHWIHESWLDYVESSLAMPVMVTLFSRMQGDGAPVNPRIERALETHLGHVEARVKDRAFLMGDALTLADMQMSYIIALAEFGDMLGKAPHIRAYWERLQADPGFARATGIAGQMAPPRR